MLLGLPLSGMAHAAPHTKLRYLEGELLIEKTGGHEDCQRQVGKTREVQISWQGTRKDGAESIAGWIVFAGGAPAKLAGPLTEHYQAGRFTLDSDDERKKYLSMQFLLTEALGQGKLKDKSAMHLSYWDWSMPSSASSSSRSSAS